ncbi:cell division protein FtsQ/DivIB [Parvimonas sp. G1425]|uniref:cell division protein FtsQ/DivIB n=1 Tax=Parvimonas sp. G1425 TaxID=3387694 RepID=UPI0039E43554
MSNNNKGKKPKIFVKKRTDEISSTHDEFYEYDSLKSRNDTLDESFFEEFKSVDFEKMNYEKEHPSSESINDENISSNDIIEDEVVQELKDEIIDEEEKPEEISISDIKDEIISEEILTDDKLDKLEDETILEESLPESKKEEIENIDSEEEEDDDFGSLDSEKNIVSVEEIKSIEESKEPQLVEINQEEDSNENINDEESIFNQYSISNEEELSKEGNYDSLFEKEGVVNSFDDLEEDDDFGSLEDQTIVVQSGYENISQKSNYHNNLVDTTDELEDEDYDDEEYYIDKKGRKKKKRRGFRIFFKFLLAFLLACAAITVYFGLTHDLFKIDYINVVGNLANEKELLIGKSGISVGDNIFLASSSKIKKNLKELPNIEDVKVTKNYPNIIEIEVKENFVSAYINTASGLTTIDNYGKVKELATDNSKASGAQLKGITETGLKVGEDFSTDETKVKFLLDILTKEYYFDIASIDFTNDQEIILEFKNSLKVTFGDLKDYAKKTQIIGILIKKIQLEGINATEIILNVGENPIIVKK